MSFEVGKQYMWKQETPVTILRISKDSRYPLMLSNGCTATINGKEYSTDKKPSLHPLVSNYTWEVIGDFLYIEDPQEFYQVHLDSITKVTYTTVEAGSRTFPPLTNLDSLREALKCRHHIEI